MFQLPHLKRDRIGGGVVRGMSKGKWASIYSHSQGEILITYNRVHKDMPILRNWRCSSQGFTGKTIYTVFCSNELHYTTNLETLAIKHIATPL
jgi:hypothetical protein